MANQLEVPKLNQLSLIGAPADNVSVSKLVLYVLLEPGSGSISSGAQGHIHTQLIRR